MLKLSIILLITALFFLFLYIIIGKKNKKRPAGKKSSMRRFSGGICAVCLICSAVFCVLYCKEENIKIFNGLKSYKLPEKYISQLDKGDAQKAYSLLPCGVFAQNDNIYFINSKKDCFILKTYDDSVRSFATESNDTVFTGGEKTLRTVIKGSGELILDGYFLYSKYDEEYLEYSDKTIAKNVKCCSCTDNSLFYITNDADLYGMGFNEYGQLSDTTTKNKTSPVFIMSGIESADISDTHAMFIDKYGTLYASGDNSYSQLGNKNAISSTEITKVMQGVKDAKVGNYFSLVLTVNGELYTAGTNEKGQLGNNGGEFKAELIPILNSIEKIDINQNTCAALTYGGELYVWGDNTNNKAGVNGQDIIAAPVKIQENVYDFALGSSGVVVLTKDRNVLLSASDGNFESLIEFQAVIPEQYRDKNPIKMPDAPEKV